MFTVITRTANRPRFFEICRRSVLGQRRQPYHIVVSDNPNDDYMEGDRVVRVQHEDGRGHNLYFNLARLHIPASHPWVIFLDDDDAFDTPDALDFIADNIKRDFDLILWQVQFPDRLVPGERIYLPPQAGHITGIGFCYHSAHWIDWKPYACGDFLVINELYAQLRPVWIDRVLTKMQAGPGHGLQKDLAHELHLTTS